MKPALALLIESVFTLNLLIASAYLMMSLGMWIGKKYQIESTYQSKLKTTYFLMLTALLLPIATAALCEAEIFEVSSKVWTTPEAITQAVTKTAGLLVQNEKSSFHWSAPTNSFLLTIAGFLLFGCAFHLYCLFRDRIALKRFIADCNQWRKIGRTILLLSSQNISPFSFKFGQRKYVVLPLAMLANKSHTKLAVAHEFQHHRQGDTNWSYVFGFLKAFCFWNPTFLLLKKRTEELQEFACDEALLGRQKFSALAYGQCLLWTAAFSRQTRQLVLGTTGLAGRDAQKRSHILIRRVQFMMSKNHTNEHKKNGWWLKVLAGIAVTVMSGLGIAASSTVGNVNLTMDDALALETSSSQEFPITMNEDVLRQLNRYVGTARGRKFVKESLARMGEHRNVVQSAISDYQLPAELMALPVIESGYRNLEPTLGKPHYGAGIWMFIN